jgi:hypothetical protein
LQQNKETKTKQKRVGERKKEMKEEGESGYICQPNFLEGFNFVVWEIFFLIYV